MYDIAVVGVEDQGLLLALVTVTAAGPPVALLEIGALQHIRHALGRFQRIHIPSHRFAASDA
jgi:hypothetical protein